MLIQSISNQSLSSLLGWISFSCWLLVYTPQIYENYQRKSGEGVSIYLVVIWMVGDLANLFGAAKQHLLKTMIFLSIYYTACDIVLLAQIYYYRRYPAKHIALGSSDLLVQLQPDPEDGRSASDHPGDQAPLLASTHEDVDHLHPEIQTINPAEIQTNKTAPCSSKYFAIKFNRALNYCSEGIASYVGTYVLIITIGILGWFISQHTQNQDTVGSPPTGEYGDEGQENWDLTAQILGWISAFSYIFSRLPQIFKNQQTKCHGLSLLFFVIGITGNVTYFSSILIADRSFTHLLINMSWLVGSGGTIFLDFIVLYQFWIYRHERDTSTIVLL